MPAKTKKSATKAELNQEVTELRAQVSSLQKQLASSEQKAPAQHAKRKFGWRQPVIWVSVALAVALVVVGNVFFWTGNTLVKQDRFVAATSPIIKNPTVQHTIALYTTNQVFDNFDVEQFTAQALPPKAQFLAPQLASQVKTQTQNLLNKAVSSQKFTDSWNQLLANSHQRIINYATNYTGDGTITLNDFYQRLSSSLETTKLSFLANHTLPPNIGSITIINATWLPTLHKVITHINTWRILSILLLVAFVALAMWLSKNKRRVIYTFTIATILTMFATLISLRLFKNEIASKVQSQYADGVGQAVQIIFHTLVTQTTTIMLFAALIALVTWISGRSRSAVAVKKQTVDLFSGKAHQTILGNSTNKVVKFVQAKKRTIEWVIVALLTAIMLMVQITAKSLLIYTLILLVLIVIVEIIGAQAPSNTHKNHR